MEDKNIEVSSNLDDNNTVTEEDIESSISVTLCNGASYLLDPCAFDWDALSEHKDELINNEQVISQMIHDIIAFTDEEGLIEKVTETIDEFGKSFKIDFDYEGFNISNRETALLKCFDALTVVRTVLREIKVYDAGFKAIKGLFASVAGNVTTHCDDEHCDCHECNKEEETSADTDDKHDELTSEDIDNLYDALKNSPKSVIPPSIG